MSKTAKDFMFVVDLGLVSVRMVDGVQNVLVLCIGQSSESPFSRT